MVGMEKILLKTNKKKNSSEGHGLIVEDCHVRV